MFETLSLFFETSPRRALRHIQRNVVRHISAQPTNAALFLLVVIFIQDYEVRIASLQEQVDRNSMMSSMIRYDVEGDDDDDSKLLSSFPDVLHRNRNYTVAKTLRRTQRARQNLM